MRYIIKRDRERTLSLYLDLSPLLLDQLHTWENDVTIRHLHHVCADRAAYDSLRISREAIQNMVFSKLLEENQFFFILEQEDVPVGYVSCAIDPAQLLHHEKGTFWLSIVIGDARARGRGFGKLAMRWCEELAAAMGCLRMELGVFAHNTRALRLYQSSGFMEIGRVPDFTWWQGRMHDDIRLEKRL